MTLYEMTAAERSLLELLEAGEIDEQTFADTCEAIGTDKKLEAYGKIISQMKADLESVKNEKTRLDKIAKTLNASIERMKKSVLAYLVGTGQEKAKAGSFSFRISRSEETEVDDLSLLPEMFIRVKYEPDKAAIKEAIENGLDVPGAHIKNKESVVMR